MVSDIQRNEDNVAAGMDVVTSDGDHLGTVKEVRGPYFKVNAKMHPDYWLQREFVRANSEGQLVTEFDKDNLNDYKVKDPDLTDEADAAANRSDPELLGEAGTSTDEPTSSSTPTGRV